eukprot:scaffold22501_cov33-Prasinocladus_malaysianus.AAC.1
MEPPKRYVLYGPEKVEVKELDGRGRGLVAVRPIKAGEEVVVERAAAWATATPLSMPSQPSESEVRAYLPFDNLRFFAS